MQLKRIPLVAGNWKMNFDHLEATYFVQQLAWKLRNIHFDYRRCEIALMPSFTSLRSVQVAVASDNLKIRYGAQAVSVTSQGAFTGDVSADMIARLGCSYVIVGHSERRKYHPEDDANIVDQVRAVLAAGMQPILCVGESYEERRKGIELAFAVIGWQAGVRFTRESLRMVADLLPAAVALIAAVVVASAALVAVFGPLTMHLYRSKA